MKLVLNHTSLTPEARSFIPDKPGCPDYVALDISSGTSSVQWCTPSLVYASEVKIKEKQAKFRVNYGGGIYCLTHVVMWCTPMHKCTLSIPNGLAMAT